DRSRLGPLRPGAVPGGDGRGVRARQSRSADGRHPRRCGCDREDRARPHEGVPGLLRAPRADGGRGRAVLGGQELRRAWEAPDMHQTTVRVAESAFGANETIARENGADFDAAGVTVINLMGAPGAGKTALLERVLEGGIGDVRVGVLEG